HSQTLHPISTIRTIRIITGTNHRQGRVLTGILKVQQPGQLQAMVGQKEDEMCMTKRTGRLKSAKTVKIWLYNCSNALDSV
ncbi:hypothetical protein scyTo_0014401, partial [Scyliorhinus torazame]|nr:hypothetical protein [Scyliorhinus torazame]